MKLFLILASIGVVLAVLAGLNAQPNQNPYASQKELAEKAAFVTQLLTWSGAALTFAVLCGIAAALQLLTQIRDAVLPHLAEGWVPPKDGAGTAKQAANE